MDVTQADIERLHEVCSLALQKQIESNPQNRAACKGILFFEERISELLNDKLNNSDYASKQNEESDNQEQG